MSRKTSAARASGESPRSFRWSRAIRSRLSRRSAGSRATACSGSSATSSTGSGGGRGGGGAAAVGGVWGSLGRLGAGAGDGVDRRVVGDLQQPGPERGVGAVAAEAVEGAQEGVLADVLGLFAPGDPRRDANDHVAVALH